jgi:hypothetical protein
LLTDPYSPRAGRNETNQFSRFRSPGSNNNTIVRSKPINPTHPSIVTPRFRQPAAKPSQPLGTTQTPNTNQTKTKSDICISHLATSLHVPESKPCRHGDNCRLTHVTVPSGGGKLHPGTKAKVLAHIASRYAGNSSFKDNLLIALQSV